MKQPPCACISQVEAEGTLRLHRQTGALHLARASPSVTCTGRGIDGVGVAHHDRVLELRGEL